MTEQVNFGLRIGKRKFGWAVIALLLITTGFRVSSRLWFVPSARATKSAVADSSLATPLPLSKASLAQTGRGVIHLLPTGFSRTEVSGQAGQYSVAVTRSSASDQIVLRLERANGEIVQEIEVPTDKAEWATQIGLEVGSYTLRVVNHSEWTCHLTIESPRNVI